jgi:lysophospholipase L1-like esterase
MASLSLRTVVALFCLATLTTVSLHPISAAEGIPEALALHKDAALRIMVIGDSITAGIEGDGGATVDGGYRGRLAELLGADGYHVTFVGARADFASHLPALRHEGWPGYVIRATSKGAPGQLLGPLVERALTKYDPDLILLMAGTNDLLRYEADDDRYDQSEIVASMDLLLRQIYRVRPHVRVILAGIVDSPKLPLCMIERFDTGRTSCETGTFANLHSLADQYTAAGYPVRYAEGMFDAVPRDATHFPDGIHPAAGPHGYDAIADVWYNAIHSITAETAGTVSTR